MDKPDISATHKSLDAIEAVKSLPMFREPETHIAELAELLCDVPRYHESLSWKMKGWLVSALGENPGWAELERVNLAYRKLLQSEPTPKLQYDLKIAWGAWVVALNKLEPQLAEYIAKNPKSAARCK